eukprot:m.37024 g.37024  ORF g.37024 m.37024 type:complete len:237 (+) comp44893_c0_seq9:259-969(+)
MDQKHSSVSGACESDSHWVAPSATDTHSFLPAPIYIHSLLLFAEHFLFAYSFPMSQKLVTSLLELRSLRHLSLRSMSSMTVASLHRLVRHASLTSFQLECDTAITSDALAAVSEPCSTLRALGLSYCTKITLPVSFGSKFPAISSLDISATACTPADLKNAPASITQLSAGRLAIFNDDLRSLARFASLTELRLVGGILLSLIGRREKLSGNLVSMCLTYLGRAIATSRVWSRLRR